MSDSAKGIFWLAVLVVMSVLAMAYCAPVTSARVWYSFTTDASYDHIAVEEKPIDCDWSTAPLGTKQCRYERSVVTSKCGAAWEQERRNADPTGEASRIWPDAANSAEGRKALGLPPDAVGPPKVPCVTETYVGWVRKNK